MSGYYRHAALSSASAAVCDSTLVLLRGPLREEISRINGSGIDPDTSILSHGRKHNPIRLRVDSTAYFRARTSPSSLPNSLRSITGRILPTGGCPHPAAHVIRECSDPSTLVRSEVASGDEAVFKFSGGVTETKWGLVNGIPFWFVCCYTRIHLRINMLPVGEFSSRDRPA